MLNVRKVIAFQGRVGDTAEGNVAGALCLARFLSEKFGLPLRTIGDPLPFRSTSWDGALESGRVDLTSLAEAVAGEIKDGFVPLCILPTDASSIAVHAAALAADANVSMLWFDAHADFNTPATTQSGYLGGMALAGSCGLWETGFGRAITPDRILALGVRAIDPAEQLLLDEHKVAFASPSEAQARLSGAALEERRFIHLDLDCLEPGLVPTQYVEPEGFEESDMATLLKAANHRSQLAGISVSEFFDCGDQVELRNGLEVVSRLFEILLQANA